RVWTTDELLAIAFKHPPVFAPGTKFDYCNTNYALLGLIAEKVEGAPLARIFQDRLFGPLGMKDTLLPASTSNTIPAPYAHGYLSPLAFLRVGAAPYPRRPNSCGQGGHAQAQRRHKAKSFLCLGGRWRHLHRR